jgi:1-acyl-sn-glycerol-3-phosphate acyltransferase
VLYALIARALLPLVWWGRMHVAGAELVPDSGPVLLVPNHDSQMDPVVVGVALRRRRKVHFLARANLWKLPGLGPVLSSIGQIPIERGAGDAAALDAAIVALHGGELICVFPEGKLSLGRHLRAHSGVGRLRESCPEAAVVLCAVTGTTDYVRFPRRPRVRIEFFPPPAAATTPAELLEAVRLQAPPTVAGRHPLRRTD